MIYKKSGKDLDLERIFINSLYIKKTVIFMKKIIKLNATEAYEPEIAFLRELKYIIDISKAVIIINMRFLFIAT